VSMEIHVLWFDPQDGACFDSVGAIGPKYRDSSEFPRAPVKISQTDRFCSPWSKSGEISDANLAVAMDRDCDR
jgi:hypothetical protein